MSTPQWLLGATQATPELTPSALARRVSMREMLQAAVVTRRRRRHAFRWAVAAALVAVLALVGLPETGGAADSGLRRIATFNLETVRDDPGLLTRYAVPPSPISPETWIGDDELLELLDSAGRSTGLIRVDRKVTLTADVTDEIEVEN